MWADIPNHLLVLIVDYLGDTKWRLSASAVCKRWREIVVDCSDVTLKRRQIVEFICGKRGRCMTDFDVKMIVKFISHTDKLLLKWCVCKTDNLLTVLSKILEVEYLPATQLKIAGSISVDPRACEVGMLQNKNLDVFYQKQKVELFSSFLKCFRRLEVLDLGFESEFSHNVSILTDVMDKINSGKLHTLNIAAVQQEVSSNSFMSENMKKLSLLSTVCLNWDRHLQSLMNILSARPSPEIRLKHLIVVIPSFPHIAGDIINKEQVLKAVKNQEGLKLKLVVVEDNSESDGNNMPAYMYVQMETILYCFQELLFLYSGSCCRAYVIFFSAVLHSGTHCPLESISIHYAEVKREMEDETHFHFIKNCGNFLLKLQKKELCGMYIRDHELIEVATAYGRRLKEFFVHQMDVVHESEVTGYMLPVTKAKAYGIEKAVSAALGKNWQLLKTRHTNRSVGGSVVTKLKTVLQQVCDVTTET